MKLRPFVYPLALVAFATGIALSGCSKKEDNPAAPVTPPDTVHFATQIKPLFEARCAPCHITDSPRKSNLDLTTHAGVLTGGFRGRVVIPDSASFSLMIKKLKGTQDSTTEGQRMPRDSSYLSADSVALIEKWINQGAKDN